MTPVQAIVAKELRSHFVSPVVYVVSAVFLLIFGILSYFFVHQAGLLALSQMQLQGGPSQINLNDLVFRPTFYSLETVLLLLLPILTMRLFAEERKLRTFELLMTSPIGTNEIVVGKFLGVYLIYLGLLGLTGIVPLVLSLFSSFDWHPVLTGYLGLALLGAVFLATGLFASTLTENQIVAALISFGILILVLFLQPLGGNLGDSLLGNTLSYVSYAGHFDRLVRGLIDTKDLVYYASSMVLMLFLAHRVVESHRWK